MKRIIFTLSIATLLLTSCGPQGWINLGHKNYDKLAYKKAIKQYKRGIEKGGVDSLLFLNLAECYRLTDQPDDAIPYYQQVVKTKHDPEVDLRYGQCLMNMERYDEANQCFKTYQKSSPKDSRGPQLLEATKNVKALQKSSNLYNIASMPFNTEGQEFGPTFMNGSLMISTDHQRTLRKYAWNGTNFLDLYEVEMDGEMKTSDLEKFSSRVNSKYHEAIGALSPDSNTIYFTRNNYVDGKVGMDGADVIRLGIYSSSKENGKWKKIISFPFNNDDFSVAHPAIEKTGKRIYFSSDMPGGNGGMDIFYSEMKDGNWGTPVNLGPNINTEGDEVFPWISPDNQLYFSSDGLPGIGGLDIFVSSLGRGGFSSPDNMGLPLNSPRDDFQAIYDRDRNMGYFTSNRYGGRGGDDIYSFVKNYQLRGVIVDTKTGKPINGGIVLIDGVPVFKTGADGKFLVGVKPGQEVTLGGEAAGYDPSDISMDIPNDVDGKSDDVTIKLDPIPIELSGIVVDDENKPVEGIKILVNGKQPLIITDATGSFKTVLDAPTVLKERKIKMNVEVPKCVEMPAPEIDFPFYIIYYDFDRWNLRSRDVRAELDLVHAYMTHYSDVSVQLRSHTDSRAGNRYNEKLSKRRCKEAYNYLIKKGVAADRLEMTWHGEKEPVNECVDGVRCSEDAHQLNRRTEFKVIKK